MAELLIFSFPPATQPALLLLGQDDVENAQATLACSLAPPTLAAQVSNIVPARAASALSAPALAARVVDPATFRRASLALVLPGAMLTARAVDVETRALAKLQVALPPPWLLAEGRRPREASLAAALSPPVLAATAEHRLNVERPLVSRAGAAWQSAGATSAAISSQHAGSLPVRPLMSAAWQRSLPQTSDAVFRRRGDLVRVRLQVSDRFQAGSSRSGNATSRFRTLVRLPFARVSAFSRADSAVIAASGGFQDRARLRVSSRTTALPGVPLRFSAASAHAVASARHLSTGSRFREAVVPPPGYGSRPPLPPTKNPCYEPSGHLLFVGPAAPDGYLLIVCDSAAAEVPAGPIVIPVLEVYMVTNDFSLTLLDGTPVPALAASISLDAESWTWGASASLPGAALSMVSPDSNGPIELIATVNGTAVRLIAEQIVRERTFGESTLRVTCRGRNAVLDSPYAPTRTFSNSGARTSQQLVTEALTINGVPIGWNVDFDLDDWLVPAGVWSHQGTFISALNAIAAAGGGYLQPHPTAMSMTVKRRYPTAPWDWASQTPDLVLPSAVVTRESMIWKEKPAYNRVFVSGQVQGRGVLGNVKRAGTAGDIVAPMVVDALITDITAARQRGLVVLADTGRQIEVGLRLPVLPATGLVLPGALVEYQDGADTRRGLVRSMGVEVGGVETWQTLGVEVHA